MSLNLDRSRWTRVAFGDVIDSITDRVDNPSEAGVERYVGLEHLDPGVMTVQRWDSPDKVEAQKLRFQPGDVIFGRRRAYQKKVAVADFEGICSAHALVLRARPGRILPEFLPVFLSSDYFLDRAIGISVGSLSPTINWRDLKIEEFDLPPLDEQKRLADLLWAAERENHAIAGLSEALNGARKQIVAEFMSRHTSDSQSIQKVIHSLGDGPFGSKIKSEHYDDSGVRVLRLKDVGVGFVTDDDIAYLNSSHVDSDLKNHRVAEGNIVIAGLGDEAHPVGRAALVTKDINGAVHKADIFRMVVDTEYTLPIYMVEALNSDWARQKIGERSQGTTRLRINTTNLRKVLLPFPSIQSQQSLLNDLKVIDASRQIYLRREQIARQLKRQFMDIVFGGGA